MNATYTELTDRELAGVRTFYAVMQQHDVTPDSRTWAEWSGEQMVIHSRKSEAESALARIAAELGVPADSTPWIYAGLAVREVRPNAYALIVR